MNEELVLTEEEKEYLNNPPTTRSHCFPGERPCIWIRCRHHMIWVRLNYNDRPTPKDREKLADACLKGMDQRDAVGLIFRMKETCTLDAQRNGPLTLEQVGACLAVTRERVRQIEDKGLRKMQHLTRAKYLLDFWKLMALDGEEE